MKPSSKSVYISFKNKNMKTLYEFIRNLNKRKQIFIATWQMTSESGKYQRLWALLWHRKFVFVSFFLLFFWRDKLFGQRILRPNRSILIKSFYIPYSRWWIFFFFSAWCLVADWELRAMEARGRACTRILNPKSKHFHKCFSTWKCFINCFVVSVLIRFIFGYVWVSVLIFQMKGIDFFCLLLLSFVLPLSKKLTQSFTITKYQKSKIQHWSHYKYQTLPMFNIFNQQREWASSRKNITFIYIRENRNIFI